MREARTPKGKGRASSRAVLKLLRAFFWTNPLLGCVDGKLDLSTGCFEMTEGSGASKTEVLDGRDVGAPTCPLRFRRRYFRIHAALCAGSR